MMKKGRKRGAEKDVDLDGYDECLGEDGDAAQAGPAAESEHSEDELEADSMIKVSNQRTNTYDQLKANSMITVSSSERNQPIL